MLWILSYNFSVDFDIIHYLAYIKDIKQLWLFLEAIISKY